MKKLLFSLATIVTIATADFLSVSVGAGIWQENIDGYIKSGDYINYFNYEDDNPLTGDLKLNNQVKPYIWAKFIHPLPLIPNVKAEYRQYETNGKNGYALGDMEIFGANIPVAGIIDTDIKIDSYDITAFYEFNLLFNLEAGLGVNVLNGSTKTVVNKFVKSSVSWSVPIPYLYGKVETPKIFGFSVEAQGKYVDVTDAFYHDYQGALKYHFYDKLLDLTISAGYKTQEIYGKDGDNETDMKFEGGYMEVGAKW